jgi:ribosomal protein S6
MFILKSDLSESDKKAVCTQINETIIKHGGDVSQSSVWAERRKFYFPIKKAREGTYYLVNFSIDPAAIDKIRHAYNLNENILRMLISVLD